MVCVATPEEAIAFLAHTCGCYSDPPQDEPSIERTVLDLIQRHPGNYSARQLRSMANRRTGLIACTAARCDAAVKRLIKKGGSPTLPLIAAMKRDWQT